MEQLERYVRVNAGQEEVLYRCRHCGVGNQGGWDNGYVPMLPYPHTRTCPVRDRAGKRMMDAAVHYPKWPLV